MILEKSLALAYLKKWGKAVNVYRLDEQSIGANKTLFLQLLWTFINDSDLYSTRYSGLVPKLPLKQQENRSS